MSCPPSNDIEQNLALSAMLQRVQKCGQPRILRISSRSSAGDFQRLLDHYLEDTSASLNVLSDPRRGERVLGVGELNLGTSLGLRGLSTCPVELQSRLQSLVNECGETGLSARPPLAFVGYSFNPRRRHEGTPWAGWPEMACRIPRVSLLEQRVDGEACCEMVLQVLVRPSDTFSGLLEQLWQTRLLLGVSARIEGPLKSEGIQERGSVVEPPLSAKLGEPVETWQGRVAEAERTCRESESLCKLVLACREQLTPRAGWRFSVSETFRRLSEGNPAAIAFFFRSDDERVFLGATPETLARVEGRRLSTHALAGTERRGASREEDLQLSERLLQSDKNLREHRWVIDGVEQALCGLGVLEEIPGSPQVLRLERLQHLETPLQATLNEGVGLLDLCQALHPTPALGGYPREEAQQWLFENEPLTRGWYGAPVGWVDPANCGLLVVAIRSVLLSAKRADLFAGAGIVPGSDPRSEWDEVSLKLQTARGALVQEVCS